MQELLDVMALIITGGSVALAMLHSTCSEGAKVAINLYMLTRRGGARIKERSMVSDTSRGTHSGWLDPGITGWSLNRAAACLI